MCGRYTLTSPLDELVESFDVTEIVLDEWRPRYNVAPGQDAPVVIAGKGGVRMGLLTWGGGLTNAAGRPLINVRSENVGKVPAYRDAMRSRRCLIPADGFYEWKQDEPTPAAAVQDLFSTEGVPVGGSARRPRGRASKTPYWFHRPDRRVFALAGLWEPATSEGVAPSFVILTTEPNEAVADVHDRMPVILTPEAARRWLDRDEDARELRTLLAPAPADQLEAWPVASSVGSADFDDPSCVLPVGPVRLVRPKE
jgi:putative SOS response-associated peptidase YedK